MTTRNWVDANFPLQTPTVYVDAIESNFNVAARFAAWFNVCQYDAVSLNFVVDAGYVWDGNTLTNISARAFGAGVFPNPVTNPRYDRIFVHQQTGAIDYVLGTESVTPTPPNVPDRWLPLASIVRYPGMTAITDNDIIDERVISSLKLPSTFQMSGANTLNADHLGHTIILIDTAASVITLPNLADVDIGEGIEIISFTGKSTKILAAAGEQLDFLADSYYRLPSFSRMKVRKLVSHSWSITDRPNFFVGQIVESSIQRLTDISGPGFAATDGSTLSRTDASNLAEVLFDGTNYVWGNGDGATTFTLPDLRGRITIGSGQGVSLTNRTIGQTGGTETHLLTAAQLPSYNLPLNDPMHVHDNPLSGILFEKSFNAFRGIKSPSNFSGSKATLSELSPTVGRGFTGITANSGGSNTPHNNMAPYNVKYRFIKL